LVEQVAPYKLLSLVLREGTSPNVLARYGEIESIDGVKATLRVPRGQATEVASHLLSSIKVDDVLIEEPPVEDIIRQVFAESRAARESDSSLVR
jgi:ABC-2 type transport system ATP-binding protein